ncbi:MAG: ABC transporter ATP-binding protein [Chloroflexi bacterium]|nr:MAG: ABC transporter ATP-binding protein [Chloroflexota bacterium]
MARLASSAVPVAIALHGVSAGYASPVLHDIDLEVGNEVVAIVGRSGSGKTTLLRLIAGLVEPTSGTVDLLGVAPAVARRRKRIGFVAQDARLHPWRTVRENVTLPLEGGRARSVVYVTHDIEEAVLLADRVIVIGGRPAGVLGEVRISLARPRTRAMRREPGFHDLVEEVREHLE